MGGGDGAVRAALRQQLAQKVPAGATVFDLGCGDGTLLLEVAERIDSGIGIDHHPLRIKAAAEVAERCGYRHLTYVCGDVSETVDTLPVQPSITIAALLFHELPRPQAVALLKRLTQISDEVLIADFEPPRQPWQALAANLRALLDGNLGPWRAYVRGGGMPGLLAEAGLAPQITLTTAEPAISIWRLT